MSYIIGAWHIIATVPKRQTAPNNQRNIRSMTSATYFQSSCVYNERQLIIKVTAGEILQLRQQTSLLITDLLRPTQHSTLNGKGNEYSYDKSRNSRKPWILAFAVNFCMCFNFCVEIRKFAILTLVLRFYFNTHVLRLGVKKAPRSLSRRTTNVFVSNCTLEFTTTASLKKVIATTTDNRK